VGAAALFLSLYAFILLRDHKRRRAIL